MLTLQLFGRWAAARDGLSVTVRTQKARALLVYLLLENRRPQRRSHLAALLWPDLDQRRALHNLTNAVLHLRQLTADGAGLIQDIDGEFLALDSSQVSTDLTDFMAIEQKISTHQHRALEQCAQCCRATERALDLLGGPLLPQLELNECEDFSDWLQQVRENLHERVVRLRKIVAQFAARAGDYPLARHHLLLLLHEEPWREEVLRDLMRIAVASGERLTALRRYDRAVTEIARQFNSQPELATRTLAEDIRAGSDLPPVEARFLVPQLPILFQPRRLRDEILARLASTSSRVVSLVGPGGSGKTFLAVACCHAARGAYAGGIIFLHAAPDWDDAASQRALARKLGITSVSGTSLRDQIAAVLAVGSWLLVFDECEQSPHVAALISELAAADADLTILSTSRQPLTLQRESMVLVSGFDIAPTPDGPSEALAFILARSADLAPTLNLQASANAASLTMLCRLTAGLPLGLELALHLLRRQPLDELLTRIAADPHDLQTEFSDIADRHRSMGRIWNEIWQTVDSTFRPLLAAVTTFQTAFDRSAAQAVAPADAPVDTALQQSVLLGILQDDRGRYSLHPLLQRFIMLQPECRDWLAAAQTQHRRYFLRRLADPAFRVIGAASRERIDQLADAITDLRGAWQAACHAAAVDELLEAREGLENMLSLLGWYDLAIEMFEQAAGVCAAVGDGEASAAMLLSAVIHQLQRDDVAAASALVERAAAHATATPTIVRSRLLRALCLHECGASAAARQQFEALRAEFTDMPPALAASLAYHLARTALATADLDTAEHEAGISAEISAVIGDRRLGVLAGGMLAQLPARRGDFAAALPLLEAVLLDARRYGSRVSLTQALVNLTFVLASLATDRARVLVLAREITTHMRSGGRGKHYANLLQSISSSYLLVNAGDHAEELLIDGCRELLATPDDARTLTLLEAFARLAKQRGKFADAQRMLDLVIAHPITTPAIRASARRLLTTLPDAGADTLLHEPQLTDPAELKQRLDAEIAGLQLHYRISPD